MDDATEIEAEVAALYNLLASPGWQSVVEYFRTKRDRAVLAVLNTSPDDAVTICRNQTRCIDIDEFCLTPQLLIDELESQLAADQNDTHEGD